MTAGTTKPKAKPRALTPGKVAKDARRKNISEIGLKPSQVLVMCALLQGKDMAEAGVAGGVTKDAVKNMLSLSHFRSAYEKALSQIVKRAMIDKEGLIEALIPLATLDVRPFYGKDGEVVPPTQWTPEMGRQVSGLVSEDMYEGVGDERRLVGVRWRISFWPKTDAADKLAKLLGAYAAKKHEVKVGVVVVPAKTPAPESRPLETTFVRKLPAS